jgi:AraC family transcriptional regulator, regulatory protein of adaptative response / methylated-DNA-[protein]-cysteine methyltransferase
MLLQAPQAVAGGRVPTRLIPTPLGPMLAGATARGLCLLEFTDRRALPGEIEELGTLFGGDGNVGDTDPRSHLDQAESELASYFSGDLRTFTVALDTPGSRFEADVWTALRRIPYGRTCSYSGLARRLGRDGGQRAVGRANGRNRVAIIVPCHRVIQEDGGLGGYGGGLDRKSFLLELEATVSGAPAMLFATIAGPTAATPAGR